MAAHTEVLALHRYFVWADRMRVHFNEVLAARNQGEGVDNVHLEPDMAYWYGGMYVVIEGWQGLGLAEPTIDALLTSPHVELLHRYRNGSFHFQKKYFDDRFTNFWSESETPRWVREVREAFSRWFLDYFERKEGGR